MTNDKYMVERCNATCCPNCREAAWLLSARYVDAPAFYICFDCEWIGQVGVGQVKAAKEGR